MTSYQIVFVDNKHQYGISKCDVCPTINPTELVINEMIKIEKFVNPSGTSSILCVYCKKCSGPIPLRIVGDV